MEVILNHAFTYVKIVALVQFVLLISCLLTIYLVKLAYVVMGKRGEKNAQRAKALLWKNFFPKSNLSPRTIKHLQRKVELALQGLLEEQDYHYNSDNLPRYLSLLAKEVLRPKARKLANKRHWFKKYIAALCFQYGFEPEDTPILLNLINHKQMLVSMNAAKAAIKFFDGYLIEQMVHIYLPRRQVQKITFAKLLSLSNVDAIITILKDRMHSSPEQSVRLFCEWLINEISFQSEKKMGDL